MKKTKITQSQKRLNGKTILLCITGSIAAYRACDLLRDLKAEGANVFCLMTEAATRFVTPLTFHSLSGNPVYSDPFSSQEDWNILHTTLADKADLILIAPATADMIARLAHGFANDLVSSVVLASRAKVMVVAAMNDNMYSHITTQENLKKLEKIGYQLVSPIEGDLICGRVGMGHIEANSVILDSVLKTLRA